MKTELKSLNDCKGKTIKASIFPWTQNQLILWFTDDTFICFAPKMDKYDQDLKIDFGNFNLLACQKELIDAGFISADELQVFIDEHQRKLKKGLEEFEREYDQLRKKYGYLKGNTDEK